MASDLSSISLISDVSRFQQFSETIWAVNSMKTITFFEDYQSNTYLINAQNPKNADLLNHISESDLFGCYLDMRNLQGNYKLNHIIVSCSQGTVILFSFDKGNSNEVIKSFFSKISSKNCYGKGFTAYHKFLKLYGIPLKCRDVESREIYSGFSKFRNSMNSISNTFDNYRAKTFTQSSEDEVNMVLECLALAFEAATIDYYFTCIQNSITPRQLQNFVCMEPDSPPGMYHSPNLPEPDLPPGLALPPGFAPMNINNNSAEILTNLQKNSPSSKNDPKIKVNENEEVIKVKSALINPKMFQKNEQKKTKINKQFWKNLETLAAIMSSKEKIEVKDSKYICKACDKCFETYVFLLEHCWDDHRALLD